MRWLLAILLLGGCDSTEAPVPTTEPDGVATLKAALPAAESMTIQMPGAQLGAPEHATFYNFTRGVSYGVNTLVRTIAVTVEDIVDRPPSDTDGSTYAVWGPWTDALAPVTYRVRVDAVADGYDYRVDGWPKGGGPEDAQVVLAGHTTPAAGAGAWHYDLTAANALDPIAQDSRGRVSVEFKVGATRSLEVTFAEVEGPRAPTPTSTLYRYTEDADGAGTLDYITNADIHAQDDPTKDRRELLQVRSRWRAAGPGRADVFASQGDLPPGVEVQVVQCWDAAFAQSYSEFAFPGGAAREGEAAACPFADRERPEFAAFDPADFADEDLVAALPTAADFALGLRPIADAVAEPAAYYRLAVGVLAGIELQVGAVLGVLREVTRGPATRCDAQGCTWGPWTDWGTRVTWRVAVERAGGDAYGYSLVAKFFGEPVSAWRTIVEGGFVAGDDADGQGWFAFDHDALGEVDAAHPNRGQVRVEYARLGIGAATAMRVDGDSPARYAVSVVNGAGHLDARFPANIHGEEPGKSAVEDLEARVRWRADGAGVGDVTATHGNLGEAVYAAVECWDARAAQTHFAFVVGRADAAAIPDTDGPGCVFTDWQGPEFRPLGDEP